MAVGVGIVWYCSYGVQNKRYRSKSPKPDDSRMGLKRTSTHNIPSQENQKKIPEPEENENENKNENKTTYQVHNPIAITITKKSKTK